MTIPSLPRESRSPARSRLALPGAALLVLAVALAGGPARAEEGESHEKLRLVWQTAGEGDRIELDEVDLEPGESRDVVTESGRTATLTRDADGEGLTLAIDGREIRIADDLEGLPGHRVVVRKRVGPGEEGGATVVLDGEPKRFERKIVVDRDGEAKSFVVSDGDPDVLFLRGEPGEHGFAFSTGGHPFVGPFEHLLARIEKSEKFLALDDATREIVREVVRDAAPKLRMKRLEAGADPVELGEDAVHVIVEREVEEKEN